MTVQMSYNVRQLKQLVKLRMTFKESA